MNIKRLISCFVLSMLLVLVATSTALADDAKSTELDANNCVKIVGVDTIHVDAKDAELKKYDDNGLTVYAVNLYEGTPFTLNDFRALNNYMEQHPPVAMERASRAPSLNWTTNHTWSKYKYNTSNSNCHVYSSGTGQRAASGSKYHIRSLGGVASSAILGSTKGTHTITETYNTTSLGVTVSWPPGLTVTGTTATVSTSPTYGNSVYYYRQNIEASSWQTLLVLNVTSSGTVGINNRYYTTSVSDRVRYMD